MLRRLFKMYIPGLDLVNQSPPPAIQQRRYHHNDIFSGLLSALDRSTSTNNSDGEQTGNSNGGVPLSGYDIRQRCQSDRISQPAVSARTVEGPAMNESIPSSNLTQRVTAEVPDTASNQGTGRKGKKKRQKEKKQSDNATLNQQTDPPAPTMRVTRSKGSAPDLPPLNLREYMGTLPERLAHAAKPTTATIPGLSMNSSNSSQPFSMSPMAREFQPGNQTSICQRSLQTPMFPTYQPMPFFTACLPPPNIIAPPQPYIPKRSSRQSTPQTPIVVPEPTAQYLAQALRPNRSMSSRPQNLLVILDLNGVLLYRTGNNRGSNFNPRAGVQDFISYLFKNHYVMIWSSMGPTNVQAIVNKLFSPAERERLIAVWDRTHLRLGENLLHKVQTYKQLSWVWSDPAIQSRIPYHRFDQSNTVIIDDSVEKCRTEPYNHILAPEFEKGKAEMYSNGSGVLKQMEEYLQDVRWFPDVSARIAVKPFEVVGD